MTQYYCVLDQENRPTAFYCDEVNKKIPVQAIKLKKKHYEQMVCRCNITKFENGEVIECPPRKQKWTIEKVRGRRNFLLGETDKYLLPDFPALEESDRIELINYRQALRDITKDLNIIDFAWPEKPSFIGK